MTEVKPVIRFQIRDSYFRPADTFLSGQLFRCQQGSGDRWLVNAGEEIAYLLPLEGGGYEVYCSSESYFRRYLGLSYNYAEIHTLLSLNPFMTRVLAFGKGLHMLNQEPFETLVTQLIYVGCGRTRAEAAVEKLCQDFGKKCEFSGQKFFAFPTPAQLGQASEEYLLELGLDKRAKVVRSLCAQLNEGSLSLAEIGEHSDRRARRLLCKIPGLYNRVVDRTLIFGFQKFRTFSADAWTENVFHREFNTGAETARDVCAYFVKTLGNLAGFAYLFLLNYKRNHDLLE